MSHEDSASNSAQKHNRQNPQPGERSKLRAWADHVEELIAEARERGDFDHLRGAGKPLDVSTNVYAGDMALAYSLLKNNDLLPPELERVREIDAELARADQMLDMLRHHRDVIMRKSGAGFRSDRRAYNLLRDKTESRYTAALRAINSQILSLNIVAPAPLHRRTIDVAAKLSAFAEAFPRLAE